MCTIVDWCIYIVYFILAWFTTTLWLNIDKRIGISPLVGIQHLSMFIAHDEKYQDSIIACNGMCSPQLYSDKIENKKMHFIYDLQLALRNKSQEKDHFAWSQKATARERVMTVSAWFSGRRKFSNLLIRSKSWFFMIVLRNSRQHNSWTGPKIFFQQKKKCIVPVFIREMVLWTRQIAGWDQQKK